MNRLAVSSLAIALVSACMASNSDERTGAARADLIGGQPDANHTSVVYVLATSGSFSSACSGVLLGPNFVLTSRVCISALPQGAVDCASSSFGATVDASTLTVSGDDVASATPTVTAAVSQVIVPSDSHVCAANVALLVLKTTLSASRTPIVPRLDRAPTMGETFTAVGYGATLFDSGPSGQGTRRSLAMTVACVGAACGPNVGDAELAAAAGPCSGDSGGAALAADGRVFAIPSRGAGDCSSSVFARLDPWSAFVRAGAATAATAGGYAAPPWATPPSNDAGAQDAGKGEDASALDASGDGSGASGGGSGVGSTGGCSVVASRRAPDAVAIAMACACALVAGWSRRRRARSR